MRPGRKGCVLGDHMASGRPHGIGRVLGVSWASGWAAKDTLWPSPSNLPPFLTSFRISLTQISNISLYSLDLLDLSFVNMDWVTVEVEVDENGEVTHVSETSPGTSPTQDMLNVGMLSEVPCAPQQNAQDSTSDDYTSTSSDSSGITGITAFLDTTCEPMETFQPMFSSTQIEGK